MRNAREAWNDLSPTDRSESAVSATSEKRRMNSRSARRTSMTRSTRSPALDDPRSSDDFLAALRDIPTAELVRASGRDRSRVKRWKSGESRPRPREREALRDYLKARAQVQPVRRRCRGQVDERVSINKAYADLRASVAAHRATPRRVLRAARERVAKPPP